jgi:hypothetical protein
VNSTGARVAEHTFCPAFPFGASFAAGRRAAAFGRVARLLVGERLLGLIVVGLATLLGQFWP